jgi:hypothetical protein
MHVRCTLFHCSNSETLAHCRTTSAQHLAARHQLSTFSRRYLSRLPLACYQTPLCSHQQPVHTWAHRPVNCSKNSLKSEFRPKSRSGRSQHPNFSSSQHAIRSAQNILCAQPTTTHVRRPQQPMCAAHNIPCAQPTTSHSLSPALKRTSAVWSACLLSSSSVSGII